MKIHDIIIVGAGPAGIMAALSASESKKDILLLEKNDQIGKKILITGKGRCNLTSTASLDIFIEKFGKQGLFLRSAFSLFFNEDLMSFFQERGLGLKVERQGRVFPKTDRADSIVRVLSDSLKKNGVKILYNSTLDQIIKKEDHLQLDITGGDSLFAKKVILALGGSSFKATGSAGDGFRIVKKLGHSVTPLLPGLVPLRTKERWVGELQGLSLKNIRIVFKYGKKKITSEVGELIFTHFGVSGPLVLDLSNKVMRILKEDKKKIDLLIDLKPGLSDEQLSNKMLSVFKEKSGSQIKNILKDMLPQRLIPTFICLTGIDPAKKANQISKSERSKLAALLKNLPLTIVGSLGLERAMVTSGGINTKEIDPRAMESRLVSGLYFAGEIIDGAASSGGYNLQQAFSTGYLAGISATK
ncbi:NAD(P)/FAD-dependent oxidoreductase [Candidatus Omnitrophota bacterium]